MIGNGDKILLWNHNWIPCRGGLRKPFSNITNPNITVKDLWRGGWLWDVNKIKEVFTDQYDVEDICKIYITAGTDDNKKVWPFSKNGQLTTKSAYREIVKMREIDQSNVSNGMIFGESSSLKESFYLVGSV